MDMADAVRPPQHGDSHCAVAKPTRPDLPRLKRTCPGCGLQMHGNDMVSLNKQLDEHIKETGCMEDNL